MANLKSYTANGVRLAVREIQRLDDFNTAQIQAAGGSVRWANCFKSRKSSRIMKPSRTMLPGRSMPIQLGDAGLTRSFQRLQRPSRVQKKPNSQWIPY